MAKGIGLIGNFRGKVGNMVGYNLKDSNNKQTQGVRVYQPVVKNPKTYGQAEQRAKLAPINATYRALKAIIDRGQEGKAYGNKSRLAWLSDAMKAFNGGWFEKGADIVVPAWVPLSKGSLAGVEISNVASSCVYVVAPGFSGDTDISTIGKLSTALISAIPSLKNGDQLTFVGIKGTDHGFIASIDSVVLDTTSTTSTPSIIDKDTDKLAYDFGSNLLGGTVIVSREGDNGAHLRSSASIIADDDIPDEYKSAEVKAAAIKSYMAAGANTDWAEESLQ